MHPHTKDPFNRKCLIAAVFLWGIFLILFYWKYRFDLAAIPGPLKLLLTVPLPLTALIKYFNDYHYRKEDEAIKRSGQLLHAIQLATAGCAIFAILSATKPCKTDPATARELITRLNSYATPYLRNVKFDWTTTDYSTAIDSLDRFHTAALQKVVAEMKGQTACSVLYIAMIDSIGGDSVSIVCAQLKKIRQQSEALNRLVVTRNEDKIDRFFSDFSVEDTARALIRRPGFSFYEDRYSLKNYLIQVAQQLEPPAYIHIILPPSFPATTCETKDLQYIIVKKAI